jgi:hypothetical protein
VNQHFVATRGKLGFRQPAALHTAPLSPIPKTYHCALADPKWRSIMEEEYAALLSNNTWDLVPRPPGANIVIDKWIFRDKFKVDGSLDRYKARWVLGASHNVLECTTMTVQWSSHPLFTLFCRWPYRSTILFISLM